jgi:hypothetical protein
MLISLQFFLLRFADGLMKQILWLSLSLAWGTNRLLQSRSLASQDSAAPMNNSDQVILQEDFWGFGQWVSTLLLILPLMGIAEAYYGTCEWAS